MVTDRFDRRSRIARVGVHRAPETRWWRGWMTAVVAFAACVVLTVAGLFALSAMFPERAPVEIPQLAEPDPVTDPSTLGPDISVSVLDGTADGELGDAITASLEAEGWPVAASAAADSDVQETTVYYAAPEQRGIALGLVQAIGLGSAEQIDTPISGSPITIVLGEDAESAPTTPSP